MNALYDYYCTDDNTGTVSSTTRCPALPAHIRCNAHDIASTFKRFLSGLPGGILGSLSLFDALVAIHSQLRGSVELHRTKESKLRARLIALAIGTVESQYRRELICAVFGLLCLVGRVAENAPREDECGRPLPVDGLMGYNALAIVFGPLLIGDMIDDYSAKVADPTTGLLLLPVSPPRSRKERHKQKQKHKSKQSQAKTHAPKANPPFAVNIILIANKITEMVIVHWREVVRHIRSTGSVKTRRNASNSQNPESVERRMPSSTSESFAFRNLLPRDHDHLESTTPPMTDPRPPSGGEFSLSLYIKKRLLMLNLGPRPWNNTNTEGNAANQWIPRAGQTTALGSGPIRRQSLRATTHLLSPTIEESPPPRIEAPMPVHPKADIYNMANSLTMNAYSTYSKPRPSWIHGSGCEEGIDQIENFRNELARYMESDIPGGVYSLGTPKQDIPSVSLSREKKDSSSCAANVNIPSSDSHRFGDMTPRKLTSSPSPSIRPPTTSTIQPNSQKISSHEYELRTSDIHVLQQITPGSSRPDTTHIDSNSVAIENEGPKHAENDELTAALANTSTEIPPNDSHLDQHPETEVHSRQVMDLQLDKKSQPTPTSAAEPGRTYPLPQDRPNCETEEAATTPADQWRRLVASSKSSTESLRKLAKERRLKRSSIHGLSRSSQAAATSADPKPTTPTRKRQSIQEWGDSTGKSTAKQPEKRNTLGETPRLTYSTSRSQMHHFPPGKYSTNIPLRGPRRSPSRPIPGAVKAMAALFDNSAHEALNNSAVSMSGRFRQKVRGSDDYCIGRGIEESPTKRKATQGSSAISTSTEKPSRFPRRLGLDGSSAANTHYSSSNAPSMSKIAPSQAKDTATSTLGSPLAPMNTFPSPSIRVKQQSSPKKPVHEAISHSKLERPSITMSYSEEAAVEHFAWPPSTPSTPTARLQDQNYDFSNLSIQVEAPPPLFSQPTSRQASGSRSISISSLQTQILDLRRQLQARDDEIADLRHHVEMEETQGSDQLGHIDVDIETPCEQHLKAAKRECRAWRRRAKVAETRVVMLQRLGARFTGLGDGVDDGGGMERDRRGEDEDEEEEEKEEEMCGMQLGGDDAESSSGYTEDQDILQDRLRRDSVGKRATTDSDVFDEGLEEDRNDDMRNNGIESFDGRSMGVARLWEDVEEMLDLRRGVELLGRKE